MSRGPNGEHTACVTVDVPAPLIDLVSSLESQGFARARPELLKEPGHWTARLVRGDRSVRVGRDRGRWLVDVAAAAWDGGWYDARVVRAALQHRPVTEDIGPTELAAFVERELPGLLASVKDSKLLASQLDTLVRS